MRRLAPLLLVPVLLLSACGSSGDAIVDDSLGTPAAEQSQDEGIAEGEPDPNGATGDGAASSCLAGDAGCTDESFDGTDNSRPLPLTGAPLQGEPIPTGTSDTATAQVMAEAALTSDTTLEVAWDGSPCDVLVDAMVIEDDAEVRVFVLVGPESGTEACIQSIQRWTTTIELDAPLGDRALLDIGG